MTILPKIRATYGDGIGIELFFMPDSCGLVEFDKMFGVK